MGEKRGRRPAYIIISDHGESFFSNRVLGHGIKITEVQTKSVFLADGLDTEFVFPIGLSGIRPLLRGALASPTKERIVRVDPEKWIFQYVGGLLRPRFVGGATATGGIVYNFRRDAFTYWGNVDRNPPNLAEFWEQIVLHRAENLR